MQDVDLDCLNSSTVETLGNKTLIDGNPLEIEQEEKKPLTIRPCSSYSI